MAVITFYRAQKLCIQNTLAALLGPDIANEVRGVEMPVLPCINLFVKAVGPLIDMSAPVVLDQLPVWVSSLP